MAVKLSLKETEFLEVQSRLKKVLSIPAKKRSDSERKEYDRLRKKYAKEKGKHLHLVEERDAATDAQQQLAEYSHS